MLACTPYTQRYLLARLARSFAWFTSDLSHVLCAQASEATRRLKQQQQQKRELEQRVAAYDWRHSGHADEEANGNGRGRAGSDDSFGEGGLDDTVDLDLNNSAASMLAEGRGR